MKISFRSAVSFLNKTVWLAFLITGFTATTLTAQAVNGEPVDKIVSYAKKKNSSRSPVSIERSLMAPPNDNFANAQLFNADGGGLSGTNAGATGEANEPYHGAGRGGDQPSENNSVWYKYTPVVNRVVTLTISVSESSNLDDSVMSVYTGSTLGTLTPVAESDDYPNLDFQARVTFTAMVGQTYYVAVDGYGSDTGDFVFQYHTAAAAYNDDFANADDLTITAQSPTLPITGSNFGATSEGGEPVHSPNGLGTNNSIWYKWTTAYNRPVTFTLSGSSYDTVLAVYTGSTVFALTLVARNDDFGPSGTFTSQVTFYATAGVTYRIALDGYNNATGNSRLSWGKYTEEAGRRFDFDGDQQSDISIFRPTNGQWWINRTSSGVIANTFGSGTDRPTPADFTGDGKVDIAVFRPTTGEWFVLRSENSSFYSVPFGTSGDVPVPGKFDNDQSADIAVFRPSNATWYIRKSRNSGVQIEQFGVPGDIPVPADYDGDGASDIAIYRPANGQWWLKRSTAGVIAATFGVATDKPTQGDYTGDGRSDIAFWRPSTGEWFVLRSDDYSYFSVPFGISTDIPAPADYTGDGRFDPAVFRSSTGTWYINASPLFSTTITIPFGVAGDRPTANSYIP